VFSGSNQSSPASKQSGRRRRKPKTRGMVKGRRQSKKTPKAHALAGGEKRKQSSVLVDGVGGQ